MPVSFFTESERGRLRGSPPDISDEDLTTFFTLSASDIIEINKQRGEFNRLGFALQVCVIRYLGFPLETLEHLPLRVLNYVAHQLDADPQALDDYGKCPHTRADHVIQIQTYLEFRKAVQRVLQELLQWLVERVLEHQGPTFLFQLACEKLYQEHIIRPGVTQLEKMVATTSNTDAIIRPVKSHMDFFAKRYTISEDSSPDFLKHLSFISIVLRSLYLNRSRHCKTLSVPPQKAPWPQMLR